MKLDKWLPKKRIQTMTDKDYEADILKNGYNHAIQDCKQSLSKVEADELAIVKLILKPHQIVRGMTQALQLKETDPIVSAIAKAIAEKINSGELMKGEK